MWQVRDPLRYAGALTKSHRVSTRLEVWSDGRPIVANAPFIDGQVTDTWVAAGIRRTLDLTMAPSKDWDTWLKMPRLEFRPYRGIRYSSSDLEECPLGVFPIMQPEESVPIDAIKVQADDYWQRIVQADFSYPVTTLDQPAVAAAAALFALPTVGPVQVLTTSPAFAKGGTLDGTRHDAMVGYAKSFNLEIYFDRLGVPTVADASHIGVASPPSLLVDGTGGVESLVVKPDWDKVFNQVSVTSTAKDVAFPAQVAVITDRANPVAQWRVGARVMKYSSPLLMTAADGLAAAQNILEKVSQSAVTYVYTCVPDARRDAGDTVRGSCDDTASVSDRQIAEITHPLTVDGRQTITTVTTQPEIPA